MVWILMPAADAEVSQAAPENLEKVASRDSKIDIDETLEFPNQVNAPMLGKSDVKEPKNTEINYNASVVKESENANVRATFIHVIGDVVQSVGVVIAATIIVCEPTWLIIDPICTFIFALIVCVSTYAIIKDCLHVLCEGVPEGLDTDALTKDIASAKGVKKLHDFHCWSLTDGKVALTAIVEREDGLEGVEALRWATLECRKQGIFHTTIQVMTTQEMDRRYPEFCDIHQNVHSEFGEFHPKTEETQL
jgi:Co/Zn/Cd efflux system component